MRNKIFIAVGVILAILLSFVAYAFFIGSKKSPFQETTYKAGDLNLKVTYCKPFKKGRVIFGTKEEGALQPNGGYWRIGANSSTEITFSKDVTFGGKPVSAGTYRMYAVLGAENWDITLNSEQGTFGAFEPNQKLDVITVSAAVKSMDNMIEQLTIDFDGDSSGANMHIKWDKTIVSVPIGI